MIRGRESVVESLLNTDFDVLKSDFDLKVDLNIFAMMCLQTVVVSKT